MSALKVGDVCVLFGLKFMVEYNGMQCEILDGPSVRATYGHVSGIEYTEECYCVRVMNGTRFSAFPRNLRRIPPKQDDQFTAGEWELCPWQPNKQKERA